MLVPMLVACASKPPEYAEIDGRFRELVEASAEINKIFFGEGLETYERITDPKSTTTAIVEEKTAEDGTVTKVYHYYYIVPDKTYGEVYAYRKSYLDDYTYLQVFTTPMEGRVPFYESEERSQYAYVLEGYTEPEYEFFYDSDDPADYDYVKENEKYRSVADIKAAAEKVYSKEYLDAIYATMFIGTMPEGSVEGFSARYIEYADDEGNVSLMKSNQYEPLIHEVRQFDFSTAKIIRPANGEFVTITVDTYLPSAPEARLTVKMTMILQDGVWMLDSATY